MEISCFLGKAVAFGLNLAGWFSFLLCNAASLLRVVSLKGRARRLRLYKKNKTQQNKKPPELCRKESQRSLKKYYYINLQHVFNSQAGFPSVRTALDEM